MPLFSVITPTHDPKFLGDAFRSLRHQPPNWEWIIRVNGPQCGADDIPREIREDSRVTVTLGDAAENQPIGYLKSMAFHSGSGEYLVELDHDDMLAPGVLARLAEVIEQERPDFLYTDTAVFVETIRGPMLSPVYDERHGWESYDVRVFGHKLRACRAFPATPRSLCEVFYAPDHVRVWRKEFYRQLQGHNVELPVLDDLDLIARSYLAGGKFRHVPTCGYLYRRHAGNAHQALYGEIVARTPELRRKYLPKLVDAWCLREDLPKLQWSFDANPSIMPTTQPNQAGLIEMSGSLWRQAYSQIATRVEEAYTQLVPGGWLVIRCPSVTGYNHWGVGLKSYWHPLAFRVFCDREEHRVLRNETGQACRFRFQLVESHEEADPKTGEVTVTAYLCALKGQRQPGRVLI